METYSFNFCNLSLYQAVKQIVAQENLDFGRVYNNNKTAILYSKGGKNGNNFNY